MNRLQKNLFSADDTTDDKIVIVYSELMRKASFKNDMSKGIIDCKSIKTLYGLFGRKSMSRYLKKLEEHGLIVILAKAKNGIDLGCIKIIHYEQIQDLTNFNSCLAAGRSRVGAIVGVVSDSTTCNDNEISRIKNSPVGMVTECSRDIVPICGCSSIEEQKEQKNRSNKKRNTVTKTDSLSTEINLDDLDSFVDTHSKPVKKSKSKNSSLEVGKSVPTIEAYKTSYREKYGVDPIINAATRSQACKLVDSVGIEAAPKLAMFYLTHNAQWYVRNLHKFGLLLSDAEKLHTEMLKGDYMTDSLARETDEKMKKKADDDSWLKTLTEAKALGMTLKEYYAYKRQK